MKHSLAAVIVNSELEARATHIDVEIDPTIDNHRSNDLAKANVASERIDICRNSELRNHPDLTS